MPASEKPTHKRTSSVGSSTLRQLIEKGLSLLQVQRVKALGEPPVDGRQKFASFPAPTLLPHQPCIARRGA